MEGPGRGCVYVCVGVQPTCGVQVRGGRAVSAPAAGKRSLWPMMEIHSVIVVFSFFNYTPKNKNKTKKNRKIPLKFQM